MATHSSILPWRIPWAEESGRLQSIVSQSQTRLRACMRMRTHKHTHTHAHTHVLILILSVLDKAYNLELKCTLQLIYTKSHLIAKENELKNEELSNPGAPSSLQGE